MKRALCIVSVLTLVVLGIASLGQALVVLYFDDRTGQAADDRTLTRDETRPDRGQRGELSELLKP